MLTHVAMSTNPSPSKSILFGTDFSPNAAQVAEFAAAFASKRGQPLVVLHTADEFDAQRDSPEDLDRLCEQVRIRLDAEADRLGQQGAQVRGELRHGRPAEDAILDYVAAASPGLVVLSAVSKTAFDRWTLGSVSERVAEAAPVPTLIVRDATPLGAWLRGERPLKVFVAADFSDSAEVALRWVAELRDSGSCEITAGFADWPPEERRRLGLSGPEHFSKNLPEVQYILERDLEEKVTAILGSEAVSVRVGATWGRADAHLIELAQKEGADLIVVGTHQRSGWKRLQHGSVSRGILRHAPMNVACVPIAAASATAPSMQICRRVVAAVELSGQGARPLPLAYGVVAEGGTVTLVHVLEPAGSGHREPALIAHTSERLRQLIPAEAATRGIHTEVQIFEDKDAAIGIGQAAEAANADVVCIGAHARPGAVARAMGSVALRVLQQCRRPVLIVWPSEG